MSPSQSSSSGDQNPRYLSKRVMVNGQFVTLYSANGVTWLSSPEDIPDTMARLDNTRITLTEPKPEDEEASKKEDKDKKAEKAPAPPAKFQGSQYRMKGPKPRPVLRQGGKVVEGTPIEPISGAAVNMKGAADTTIPTVKLSPMEEGLRRGKIIAPLAQRRPAKAKVAPPPSKKGVPVSGKLPVSAKGKAPVAPQQKHAKGVKAIPAPLQKAKKGTTPVKAAKAAPVAKKTAQPAKAVKKVIKKSIPKKVASKSISKGGSKKRRR